MKSVRMTLIRIVLTLIYCAIGLVIALPVSYFFQSTIYSQMSWWEYVRGGFSSVMAGAYFGSFAVYRNVAIGCMLLAVLAGSRLERVFNLK
ncbi:hypothetical protein [Ostreibacterium oceani]|uniref:Uncharacterized protein n=1 Tax=Ostreibacterium oceani TaxID=2654998 RepID=A0A6N7EVT6_9GAMM|nr:hypothetical protein [Ostreibacterium oceani]MPV85705.1 hypothetical protein [Ostreibacterium oceani]